MDTIKVEIGETASKIEKVEEEVAKVESALQGGEPFLGISDRQQLLERLGALEKEKEQLRKEEEQLREKNLRLLPAPSPPAASGTPAQFMQRLEEMFQALCSKQEEITIRQEEITIRQEEITRAICGKQEETQTQLVSNAGSQTWEKLRVFKRLLLQPALGNVAEGVEPKEAPDFEWDNRLEKAQSNEYIKYLEKHIKLPHGHKFVEVANKFPNLLDWSDGLPFRLRGTTDAVVCLATADIMPQTCLLALFELKKQAPQAQHRYQALVKLLLANLRCPAFRPWVVLSDLKSCWEFFWLDRDIVKFFHVARPNALAIIETALNRQSVQENGSSGLMEVTPEEGVRGPLQKRRRMEVATSGMPGAEQDLVGFEDVLKGDIEREWLAAWMHKLAAVCSIPAEPTSP